MTKENPEGIRAGWRELIANAYQISIVEDCLRDAIRTCPDAHPKTKRAWIATARRRIAQLKTEADRQADKQSEMIAQEANDAFKFLAKHKGKRA